MALSGSEIGLATVVAQLVNVGMDVVRRMDWVRASPMVLMSAFSRVQAARSTRLMIVGATKAARMAMTAITTVVSIKVQPRRARRSEFRIPNPETARPLLCPA